MFTPRLLEHYLATVSDHISGEPSLEATTMTMITAFPTRGFIFQLDPMPADLPATLEALGLASLAARTVEGLYIEPAQSLIAVLSALDDEGIEILGMRAATVHHPWERSSRFVHPSRLRNPQSSCWLPTLPAA